MNILRISISVGTMFCIVGVPLVAHAVMSMSDRVTGRILLDVSRNGAAWYVNPVDKKRYSLGRPDNAFAIMRSLGLGITNASLASIPIAGESSRGDLALRSRLAGHILLQVESNGEAWYVHPLTRTRYFLGRPADAFDIMRSHSLGITATHLSLVPVGYLPPTGSVLRNYSITTPRGSFPISLVRLDRASFTMVTDSATTQDCSSACPAKPLRSYVDSAGATLGIHGTFFCPPDYGACASKVNSFNAPVYKSSSGRMVNERSLPFHQGPLMVQDSSGELYYFHRSKEFGYSVEEFEAAHNTTLTAALANTPSLVEGGRSIAANEPVDSQSLKTVKATRAGIGYNEKHVFLVIARGVTVIDLAEIFTTLQADYALNIDGGGSAALFYNGRYVTGPGRLLPNAILFRQK